MATRANDDDDDDDSFAALLEDYLDEPEGDVDPAMERIELDWQEGHSSHGIDHLVGRKGKKRPTREQITEAVFELPRCEETTSNDEPERTLFFGTTRQREELVVVCVDERKSKKKPRLLLVTAFFESRDDWRARFSAKSAKPGKKK